jgi:ACS family hexuronate transporter-like MFS transporter
VVPVLFATKVNPFLAVLFIGLACGAHQAWSANVYALSSDLFPKNAVAGVAGISGMLGSSGGIAFPIFVGKLLDYYKASGSGETVAYTIVFGLCSSAYLVAFFLSHLLAPKFERIHA